MYVSNQIKSKGGLMMLCESYLSSVHSIVNIKIYKTQLLELRILEGVADDKM